MRNDVNFAGRTGHGEDAYFATARQPSRQKAGSAGTHRPRLTTGQSLERGTAHGRSETIITVMESGTELGSIVNQLDKMLAANRGQLAAMSDDERMRHEAALDHLDSYLALLRDATAANAGRFYLKLEYADGRWDIAEEELPAKPQRGDVVFSASNHWRVRGTQTVPVRPPGKPPREFFICAPDTLGAARE